MAGVMNRRRDGRLDKPELSWNRSIVACAQMQKSITSQRQGGQRESCRQTGTNLFPSKFRAQFALGPAVYAFPKGCRCHSREFEANVRQFRIVVLANNCLDQTAAVIRARFPASRNFSVGDSTSCFPCMASVRSSKPGSSGWAQAPAPDSQSAAVEIPFNGERTEGRCRQQAWGATGERQSR
jgi:hypothetical protein